MESKRHTLEVVALLSAMYPGQTLRLSTEEGVAEPTSIVTDDGSTGRPQERYEILSQI